MRRFLLAEVDETLLSLAPIKLGERNARSTKTGAFVYRGIY